MRILVTGSREWTNTKPNHKTIRLALLSVSVVDETGVDLQNVLVVHGAQGTYDSDGTLVSGVDMMADGIALELGMRTERHPADWLGPCRDTCHHGPRKVNGKGQSYCQAAGMYRNRAMVGLGADVCLGFPLGRSPGTRGCMKLARLAGISVVDCTRDIDLRSVTR